MNSDFKPKLRPMVFIRGEAEGKKFLVLQDPERIAENVMLSAELEPILLMMNGNNSLLDIQVELTRRSGGEIVPFDEVKKLIMEMDARMLLDSPRFRETMDLSLHFWDVFRLRKPFHAGQAYDRNSQKLREMLESFYEADDGPGKPYKNGKFVKGLLAPHIDIRSGGPTFAFAYKEIASSSPADLYIIIGTAHQPSAGPFSITDKDYMTPLGILPTDEEFLAELLKKYNPDWLTKDIGHRNEHSNEFQVVFLLHALGAETKAKAIQVLAGFNAPGGEDIPPWEAQEIMDFIEALKETISESGKKVSFIVGGDLAHIGPRYGDDSPVIPSDLEVCSDKDHEMLSFAEKGDSKGFYNYIREEKDKRNICGLSPLYTMLALIEGTKGKLLRYDHWYDQATRSAVTFAAMVWHEE